MEWKVLTNDTIEDEVFKRSTFEKGKSLYRGNKVRIEGLTPIDNDTILVDALVYGVHEYDVELKVKKNMSYSCSCPAYQSYAGACKHIVATMLAYNERAEEHNENTRPTPIPSPQNDDYQAARYIMNQMADLLDADTGFRGRKKVQFEYHLAFESMDDEDVSSIRLKVGREKLYQVKDIEQNAQAFLNERPVYFGKDFSYDPAEHYIGTADREMLYLLLELKNYHFQSQSYYSYRSANKSELELPAVLMKDFLNRVINTEHYLIKRNHRDNDSQHIPEPIVFEEGEAILPVPFEITNAPEDDTLYQFSLAEPALNDFSFYPSSKTLIHQDEIYFLTDEEVRIISTIVLALVEEDNNKVLIPKALMKEFLMNSIPSITKRFPVKIAEKIKKEYHKEPLEVKMYLDWRDGLLWMDLEFHYGGQFYNPLMFQEDDQSLPETMLLDLEREGEVLNLLFDFDFPFDMAGKSLTLGDEEEIYRFLFDALPQFTELMEVYSTSSMEQMLYTPPKSPQLVIDMNQKNNLLHITFDIEGINEEDLQMIMKDLMANKKYRRLSNGRLVNLQDQAFQEYQSTLEKMEISPNQVQREMDLPLHRIFSLDEDQLNRAELKNPVREFLARLDHLEAKDYPLPKALDADLRPYQVEGYQWLKMMDEFGFGGILADDMGLGKTIQALTYIASTLEQDDSKPILVICPSSVLYNWQKESKQFIPSVETILITGTKEERETAITEATDKKVPLWITSYPVLLRDKDMYDKLNFRTIILDEAQIVKNNTAKTTRAVRELKANNKIALSGTPLENQLGELYSIFSIVVPGLFTSQKRFKQLEIEQINRKIRPFVLRRLKRDVLKDLPDKVETVEYIELSKEQKELYVSQLRLLRNETNEMIEQGSLESNRIKILAGLTRLRQICCDPRLIDPTYEGESTKLDRLMEYLDTARENGKRVVLFSQFTKMLELIQQRLREQGRDYFYLDGSTPNIDRLELTTRYNEGEKDLFLISLRAGGTGLNLTGGDTVILYDSWWNPAVESQATDRVHRYGQKKKVQVIRMICTGTIEERINELQEQKRELIDQVITEGKQALTSLSKDEILDILSE